MQNTLPYELSKMDEHVTVVSEQQEPYVDLFNAAVDEFNAKLRYIDNLCADPKVGSVYINHKNNTRYELCLR
jgi:hypothetical protein